MVAPCIRGGGEAAREWVLGAAARTADHREGVGKRGRGTRSPDQWVVLVAALCAGATHTKQASKHDLRVDC